MVIDAAIARLMSKDKEMAEVLVLYHCYGSSSKVAKILGMCRRRVGVLVNAGTAWVDGVLEQAPVLS